MNRSRDPRAAVLVRHRRGRLSWVRLVPERAALPQYSSAHIVSPVMSPSTLNAVKALWGGELPKFDSQERIISHDLEASTERSIGPILSGSARAIAPSCRRSQEPYGLLEISGYSVGMDANSKRVIDRASDGCPDSAVERDIVNFGRKRPWEIID